MRSGEPRLCYVKSFSGRFDLTAYKASARRQGISALRSGLEFRLQADSRVERAIPGLGFAPVAQAAEDLAFLQRQHLLVIHLRRAPSAAGHGYGPDTPRKKSRTSSPRPARIPSSPPGSDVPGKKPFISATASLTFLIGMMNIFSCILDFDRWRFKKNRRCTGSLYPRASACRLVSCCRSDCSVRS